MRQTALRITFAATAMLAAAATGSAQTLKAEIPFPFEVGSARMQPGGYWVNLNSNSGSRVIRIYNADGRHGALALVMTTDRPLDSTSAQPTLTFACTAGRCELSSLKDQSANVYRLHVGKAGPGTRIAAVLLRPGRSE